MRLTSASGASGANCARFFAVFLRFLERIKLSIFGAIMGPILGAKRQEWQVPQDSDAHNMLIYKGRKLSKVENATS